MTMSKTPHTRPQLFCPIRALLKLKITRAVLEIEVPKLNIPMPWQVQQDSEACVNQNRMYMVIWDVSQIHTRKLLQTL